MVRVASMLLANPTVELEVNFTIPNAHAALTRAALEAGRHVWSEKPLATSLEDARALFDLADEPGLSWAVPRTRSWAPLRRLP
jgi:predicted dehydrogenase